MNGIVDVYEKYFTDLTSFQFDLHKRKQHSCLVCTTNITDSGSYGIYSRKSTEKFVINYLEHLKIFNYCIKLTEIFIQSVRENGILSSKVKGHWKIKKHIIHEVIIIDHFNYASNRNLDEVNVLVHQKLLSKEYLKRGNFLKNLLAKEKEEEEEEICSKLKEKEIEKEFDFNSELNVELEMYRKKKQEEEE